jgi:hypothetical protein
VKRKLQLNVELSTVSRLRNDTALTRTFEGTFFRDADENWITDVINAAGFLPELVPVHNALMLDIRDGIYASLPGGENFGVDDDEAELGEDGLPGFILVGEVPQT